MSKNWQYYIIEKRKTIIQNGKHVKLTNKQNDKTVFGVLSDAEELNNGKTISNTAERHYSDALRGASKEQVISKFEDCASTICDKETAQQIRDMILNLQNLKDINQLIKLF